MPSKAKERLTGGQTSDEAEAGESSPQETPLRDLIREEWAKGESRSAIAKKFGVTYQRVFSLTKNTDGGPAEGSSGPRARVFVESSDAITEAGREDLIGLPRVEAARKLAEEGMKTAAIAKLLGTSYQIVYQATKAKSSDEDDEGEDEAGEADEDADEETEDETEEEGE